MTNTTYSPSSMHHCKLVEVAGLVAFHGRALLTDSTRLNNDAVCAYWMASRCRLDRWGYALRAYGRAVHDPRGDSAVRLGPLANEIVLSEVLTRIVAALFLAHDGLHRRHDSAPVGRNILVGHREAIDRLHAVTTAWWSHEATSSRALQALKDRCERWTDLLLGYLHSSANLNEFAFDFRRMNDFADDHADSESHRHASQSANLLSVGLRASFGDAGSASPNDDLHAQIAGAALGCFGAEAFDSFGLLRSTWLDRLQRTTEETGALMQELSSNQIAGLPRSPVRRA